MLDMIRPDTTVNPTTNIFLYIIVSCYFLLLFHLKAKKYAEVHYPKVPRSAASDIKTKSEETSRMSNK